MALFKSLSVSRFRNIEQISLDPGARVNLIYGANGSGKTSLLEAVHVLATGKSFRSVRTTPLINNDSNELTVFTQLGDGTTIGLQKFRNRKPLLKLRGEKQSNWVEVAGLLPVQVLDSATFRLLEGSPRERRQFLDWGVFHVEPGFVHHWRNSRKCIANRNFLLKSANPDWSQIQAWNVELSREAGEVDNARQRYFQRFLPVFQEVFSKLAVVDDISLEYRRGWDADKDLIAVLRDNEQQDRRYGSTQFGPHRADILVKYDRLPASDVLSRGQQKMLVSALKLAQGVLQAGAGERHSIFLVDDLPAELDETNRTRICQFLQQMQGQVFLTSVDDATLNNSLDRGAPVTKFHVEHGKITS